MSNRFLVIVGLILILVVPTMVGVFGLLTNAPDVAGAVGGTAFGVFGFCIVFAVGRVIFD